MSENTKPTKKQIPYLEILKQAGRIVWQHRFLLWFGLLMALGSPGSFNVSGNNNKFGAQGEAVKNFFESHWQIVLALAIVLFIVGIILFLISLIAKAGLIRSANLVSQNKKTNFKEGWMSGKKYLGKLFKLSILFFLATFVVMIILAVPVIFLVIAKSWVSAVLVGLLAIAIFVPLMFIFSLTRIFAEFYIILSDLRVRSAIEAGYNLLLKNIGNSIIFGLLLLAVSLAAGIALLPIAGIALVILIPTGAAFYYLSKIVFAVFLAFAIFLFLAVILFVAAIFQTYKTTAWTLFFREIAKVEKPEAEAVAEAEIEKPIVATPEKV
ncbi:MAG: hypothetical protein NT093_03280 [Candidatus Moranbacteria bacterium]|nr:hypothetical protein [Candidatus Moranbacteria bacterium]